MAVIAMLAGISTAFAGAPPVVGPGDGSVPFLCPSVSANSQAPGAHPLDSTGRYTFLPGHNQAGAYANWHSYNLYPAATSPAPGDGYSGWSPIWPSDQPQP